MQEVGVTFPDVQKLIDDLYAMPEQFRTERRSLLEELARTMQGVVESNIGGAGKVRSWQESRVGDLGGYAAVRPKAKMDYEGYAVGHITNAIENGHRVRPPSGHSRRYRPRIHKTRVPGKGFYAKSEGSIGAAAVQAAQAMLDGLAEKLEGG